MMTRWMMETGLGVRRARGESGSSGIECISAVSRWVGRGAEGRYAELILCERHSAIGMYRKGSLVNRPGQD